MTNTLILSSRKSDFTTFLSQPIELDSNDKYEAALLSLNLYNSIPNITDTNNKFRYSADNGISWKLLTLEKGSYELLAISNEIQRQMIINNDYDSEKSEFYITISANIHELKSIININNESYRVDFTIENSLGPTLGFRSQILSAGYNKSPDIVDITKINTVLIHTDITYGSYVNGNLLPTIYSFDPHKVAAGYKIDERPNPSLIYYPLNTSKINSIRIWLTDQDNDPVDFRGEKITIKLHIRKVQNIKQEIKTAIKELKQENIL